MPGPDRTAAWDAAFGLAYFRILGEGAGKALRPLLMSLSTRASGSEWQRVRSGLLSLNPWLARVIDDAAEDAGSETSVATPRALPAPGGRTQRTTAEHKPQK